MTGSGRRVVATVIFHGPEKNFLRFEKLFLNLFFGIGKSGKFPEEIRIGKIFLKKSDAANSDKRLKQFC